MAKRSNIYKYIADHISHLDWSKEPNGLYAPIAYGLATGGKRLRPALAIIACDMYEGRRRDVLNAALALEVFHNFTLLHDDLMDNADLRRGQPTVHRKWNANTAILSGDQMLIEAYKLIQKVPQKFAKQSMEIFSEMATQICEGQQMDMDFEQMENVNEREYLEMITKKTAVLLGAALNLGALISGAHEEEQFILENIGILIGLAFQLRDDYLDVYGNPEIFGKQIGGDILDNKKTYLYVKAIEMSDKSQREQLTNLFHTHDKSQDKIERVTELYNQIGVDKQCLQKIEFYHSQALNLLRQLNVPETNTTELKTIIEQLITRIK